MKNIDATEQAYKNGYEQGKKDALKPIGNDRVRQKLIEILRVPIYPHLDADPTEVVADYLLDNGVTLDNQVSSSKWISVKDRLPKPFTPVLVYRQSFGTLPPYIKVDKMTLWSDDTQVWTDEVGNWKNVTTHWMPLPEPPKGE